MGRKVPTGIKDFSDLDAGNYYGNIESFEEKMTKEANKLMYSAQINILQPKERAGRKYFANFVIGTDDDPNADDGATWVEKADQMKRFCAAVGVPLEGEDMDTILAHVIRKNVCFRIEHRAGTGQYAGRTFVNVTKWAQEGTMEPMLDGIGEASAGVMLRTADQPATQAPTPIAPAPVPVAAPPVPPVPPASAEGNAGSSYPFPTPPGTAA